MIAALIFFFTYAGVTIGRIPGLMLDRTGIALLGAIAMVVSGVVPFARVTEAVDFPTIILLYGLMILSAQLRLGGFYTRVAVACALWLGRPRLFLFASMLASAILSAILANDIVCLAFTPVLSVVLLRAGANPMPFLIGLACASNIGSAATIIGNPQNMLIGQVGRLDFGRFLFWCAPPSVVGLIGCYIMLCWIYRGRFAAQGIAPPTPETNPWPDFNPWQSTKGLAATAILIALFFTRIPREYSAIAVAGVLLCSRKMRSRHILELVDWHLITLFIGLFIVIYGIETKNIPALAVDFLRQQGMGLHNLAVLTGVSAVLSNLVSNVPATMLLIRFLDPSNPIQWHTLAVSSTFAGNLIVIGSIANLIVIEQAKRFGIEISFREHARVGIPVTLFTLLVLIAWIYVGS